MTNRSYVYSRLIPDDNEISSKYSSSSSRSDPSQDADSDSMATKLRRFQTKPRREKWPGSASHLTQDIAVDNHMEYVEHLIKPNETLQGLALQYRSSVFELKRVNNIVKEGEFYARRILKIPVYQHSSLKDLMPTVENLETNLQDDDENANASSDFLEQVDQDLQRLKERARVYDIDHVNTLADVNHLRHNARLRRSDCKGDDCGLSWTHIVSIALLILLACPLLYFLYLELNMHKETSSFVNDVNVSVPVNHSESEKYVAL